MEIGLFHMPLHPATRALSDVVKENTQKIIYADELGFAEAWVGEHMSATTEPITSPLVFLASLLPQTKNIKLCSGVVCLPNRHPAIVAAEVALFDHMAEGRFVFGVGPGGLASDMELFGNLDAGIRNERMAESMQMILKIWSQDPPYDIQGKHWQIKITENIIPELGVGFMQKPYTKPHPPIAMTSMSPGSSSISFAVKKGYRPVSANFAPESTIISHWAKYVEGCEAIGREPTGDDWTIARNVLIAESDAQAEDWLMDPKGSNFYYFDYLFEVLKRADYISVIKPDPDMKDEDVTVEDIVRASVIFGSPRTVAEKIRSLRERSGPFGTLLMAAMDGSGENLERERLTMRLLAQEVLPLVNAS
ncbi:LLM class flavin-dependent oxidoreductase [Paenirhodobacter populi]|uniref:LLM class flavin-dependent oxidoreductase n=1 Tax=Paenirhodobacter populi TaxID=2306993 RepID=A0A443JR45_9RHOB|nr:LLM class flavin-dependent oxidoreductase [Sinirhodobacter populi]RWR22978.1 LLM class flavin-dependent oxidoreductase [Sinirhodobacter populi]